MVKMNCNYYNKNDFNTKNITLNLKNLPAIISISIKISLIESISLDKIKTAFRSWWYLYNITDVIPGIESKSITPQVKVKGNLKTKKFMFQNKHLFFNLIYLKLIKSDDIYIFEIPLEKMLLGKLILEKQEEQEYFNNATVKVEIRFNRNVNLIKLKTLF